jgi:type II secretory pathway pseudopilin PulG
MRNSSSGQLLIEILITVSVAVVVLALGGSLIYASLKSNQSSANRNSVLGLVQEEMAGVIGASTEQWQNVFNLTKGTQSYYITGTSAWTIATGTDSKTLNNVSFVRYFTVQNICRATSTNNITGISDDGGTSTSTCLSSTGNFDPSTELVTVTVSSTNMNPVTLPEFITRWRDQVCVQQSWSSQSSATSSCSSPSTYQDETNVTTGSDLQLCSGGC